ncbi:MAG TPA: glycosyltransferase family 2 protein [Phycisphaerae bacterium]|nr:glycosyltransferase family 2 protein [Phycisphaerae bacterium]HOB74570.1 glycosyltransferase family 2 protein [Phycisphaerae bacterium]HOJ56052.1 glycosyltransferase family 2 protein [Phycisphaerae bacterium]HOL27079.1 glycosyltransferase family 2 protein [Phycisphaerae bacterium]HPP21211.1 glycosyltransferase family 2 protein [Phycisphaerae bacterium]
MSETISIIIPAYNEADRIGRSLVEVLRFAADYRGGAEVIVVDDGSTDATAALVESLQANAGERLKLVRHTHNRGKGASVRTGFEQAGGEIVLFTDADLSTPIAEAERLIGPVEAGECDVAIGSRAMAQSLIQVQQSWVRRTMGRTFNRLVRMWTGLGFSDTQCGFKAFRRSSMARVFALQRLEGFAFDVELLYLAAKFGLRVLEVPVTWSHVGQSRVSLVGDSAAMLVELIRIRLNDWRGLYREA